MNKKKEIKLKVDKENLVDLDMVVKEMIRRKDIYFYDDKKQ